MQTLRFSNPREQLFHFQHQHVGCCIHQTKNVGKMKMHTLTCSLHSQLAARTLYVCVFVPQLFTITFDAIVAIYPSLSWSACSFVSWPCLNSNAPISCLTTSNYNRPRRPLYSNTPTQHDRVGRPVSNMRCNHSNHNS